MNYIKYKLRRWLGIAYIDDRIESVEQLILHQESKYNGFAVLKKHLNRPDKPLPNFGGKSIEQD